MRVGHILLASIVLTFSGRCDEVFDGNNAGDIRHYCGNCYKCFSVEDFASCKCCSLREKIYTISLCSSILDGWRFICIRKQRTTAKDNGQLGRITEPNYLSGTKITEVLHLISSNRDIQPLQAYALVRYNLNDYSLLPYCTTCVAVLSLLGTGHFHRKSSKHSRWAVSRVVYYSNSIATLQILLRAGDMSLNPGPENNHSKTTSRRGPTRKHIAPRCSKCEKPVARNHN